MTNYTARSLFHETKMTLLRALLAKSHHAAADIEAAFEYRNRRDRRSHPATRTDNGGRVHLRPEEYCSCCDYIRAPSRKWRFTEVKHARSLPHVATLYGADEKTARKIANFVDKAMKPDFGLAPFFIEVRDRLEPCGDETAEEEYDRQIEAAWDLVETHLASVSELSLKRQVGIYAKNQTLSKPELHLMRPFMDECFRWLWKSWHAPLGKMTVCPPKMPMLKAA